jgi:hypothetical protein
MAPAYVFPPANITNPAYIQWLREAVLPPIQNVAGTCKQITVLII